MSSFMYVVVVQPIAASALTCMQHDDAYLILSRAPLVHETTRQVYLALGAVYATLLAVGRAIIIII
jgi:hypothetical protein